MSTILLRWSNGTTWAREFEAPTMQAFDAASRAIWLDAPSGVTLALHYRFASLRPVQWWNVHAKRTDGMRGAQTVVVATGQPLADGWLSWAWEGVEMSLRHARNLMGIAGSVMGEYDDRKAQERLRSLRSHFHADQKQ